MAFRPGNWTRDNIGNVDCRNSDGHSCHHDGRQHHLCCRFCRSWSSICRAIRQWHACNRGFGRSAGLAGGGCAGMRPARSRRCRSVFRPPKSGTGRATTSATWEDCRNSDGHCQCHHHDGRQHHRHDTFSASSAWWLPCRSRNWSSIMWGKQSHLYGQLARLAGEGTASGAFGPSCRRPRRRFLAVPEDEAGPVASVPPSVYDAEEEAEPEEDGEPADSTEPAAEGPEPMEESGPMEESEPPEEQDRKS